MKKVLFIILPLIFFVTTSFGQDTISTKKQGYLIVYVKSIGSKKTIYSGNLNKKAKAFSIQNRKINYIKMESGENFSPNFNITKNEKIAEKTKEKKIITQKNSFGLEPFTTISKGLSIIGEFPLKNKLIIQSRLNIAHSQIPFSIKNSLETPNSAERYFHLSDRYLHRGFSLSASTPLTLGFKPFLPKDNNFHNSWFFLPELTFQNIVEIRLNKEYLNIINQQIVADQRTTIAGSLTLSIGKNFIIYDRIKLQASGGLGYYNIFKEYFYQNYPEVEREGFQGNPFYKFLRGVQISENNLMGNFSLSIHYLF
jgi:hypothetical protein